MKKLVTLFLILLHTAIVCGQTSNLLKGSDYYIYLMDDTSFAKLGNKVTADLRDNTESDDGQLSESATRQMVIFNPDEVNLNPVLAGVNCFGDAVDWFAVKYYEPNADVGSGIVSGGLLINANDTEFPKLANLTEEHHFVIVLKGVYRNSSSVSISLYNKTGSERKILEFSGVTGENHDGDWEVFDFSYDELLALGCNMSGFEPNNFDNYYGFSFNANYRVDICVAMWYVPQKEVEWEITDDGTLIISGTGEMHDYNGSSKLAPWYYSRNDIKKVIINDGVTSIGASAFYDCDNLLSIEIPSSVTSIGSSAFSGCGNLTNVRLNEGLESIGSFAFDNCDNLTSIEIPSSVTSIGREAFYSCFNLTKLTMLATTPPTLGSDAFLFVGTGFAVYVLAESLSSYQETEAWKDYVTTASGTCGAEGNGSNLTWVLNDDGTLIISGTGEMLDYNRYTYTNESPWYKGRTNIKKVVIGEGVTSIGSDAFSNCDNLTSIEIPSGVTSIGSDAFFNCDNLTSIEIPSGVTSIGASAFSYCSSLTSVRLNEGLESIGASAFSRCDNLTSIEIPSGVTSIGASAFSYCSSLTSVRLNEGLESIGASAFSYCSSLTSINVAETNQNYSSIDGVLYDKQKQTIIRYPQSKSGSVFTIPGSVTSIEAGAFMSCSRLESVEIPSGVTSIGASAFSGCSMLMSVTINSPEPPSLNYGNTFSGSPSACVLFVPDGSVESYEARHDNSFFNEIVPLSAKFATGMCGEYTTISCRMADSIIWKLHADSTLYLSRISGSGKMADFTGCLENAGWKAENYKYKVKNVDIASGITKIGKAAFSGCSSVEAIISRSDFPPTCTMSCFEGMNSDIPVFVPANSVEAYKSHSGWSYFTNILPMRDEVENMECGMYGDNLLYSINEKGDMTITGSGNMKNYTEADPAPWPADAPLSLVVEAGATSIGANAFNGCTELQSVQLPAGLQGIGTNAFAGCGKLDYMTVTEGAMSIGSSAFVNCTALKSVTLPADMRNIGNNSFDNCYSLERIICHAAEPPKLGANGCFAEVMPYIPVYVPMQSIEAYKNAEGWDYFFNFLPIDKLYSGSCGTEGGNLVWNLTEEGVLTISGTGTMAGYGSMREQWYSGDIREVIIGEGATSIGAGAFTGCTFLESIELPSTLTEIGENAFAGCGDVTDIISFSTEPPAIFDGAALRSGTEGSYDGVFDGINPAIPVYVPAESIEAYRNAEGWNYFTNFLPIPADEEGGGVTAIEEAEETTQTELVVTAKDGRVWCNAEEYAIYDLAGRDVTSCNGTLKGIYVVIAENEAVKVAVR